MVTVYQYQGEESATRTQTILNTKSDLSIYCHGEDESMGGLYIFVVLSKMELCSSKVTEKVTDVVSDNQRVAISSRSP